MIFAKKQNKYPAPKDSLGVRIKKEMSMNYELYWMFVPVAIYFLLFAYKPMYGLLMAFQDYSPRLGIGGSEWVGFEHFTDFFKSFYFGRLMKNTVTISLSTILFGFPMPIILALLMNEVKHSGYKRTVQTLTYLPHFISMVVICSIIKKFTDADGFVNDIIAFFGGERSYLLNNPKYFVPIYVISNIWTTIGWNSIVYMAALSGVSQELYEAASIEGAGRFKQTLHVTLPCIAPTIVTMLILRMGHALTVGYEKIILLYNPTTMKTADVLLSYVYRKGLLEKDWSFSAAVGIFNSVVNLALLIVTNKISKKLSDTALW